MELRPQRMRNTGMKRLALLRHAKSDWDAGASSDFDRPICDEGRTAAQAMGRYIKHSCGEYRHALVSPARRCCETFDAVCCEFDEAPEKVLEDRIYLASAGTLLELVQAQDDGFDELLLVGHNPGLTFLALDLIRLDDNVADRERIAAKFPTAGFVQLECDVSHWSEVCSSGCDLKLRRYPIEELS